MALATRCLPLFAALTAVPLAPGVAQAQSPPAVNPGAPNAEAVPPAVQPQSTPGAAASAPTQFAPVVTTATRGPRRADDVAATVSVIDQQQLEQRDAVAPRDVVRYEPGVSVGNQPTRAGSTNYVIRGIGDNRVRVQIDGVRVPDFPSSNIGAGTYTRDFVDVDSIKRIEIVRGPASALYGSDAIGGVVAYVTKDPSDYLDATGRDTYVSGKVGYNGADRSVHETVTGAARTGRTEVLLLYTRRDGHEVAPNGSISTNPQVYQSNALLGRIVAHVTDVDTVRLTGEYVERKTATDLRRDLGITPGAGGAPSTAVLASNGRDTTQRGRVTLDYVREAPISFMDRLEARATYSRLDRQELTDQLRSSFSGPTPTLNRRRLTELSFGQDIYGGDVQLTTKRNLFGADNTFTYGVTAEYISTTRPRDRIELNTITGVATRTVAGETFPNKNFPDTGTTLLGVYAQDEIELGRLRVVPAVRLDYYRLRAIQDADFLRSSGGLMIKPIDEVAVSPKLGAVYKLDGGFSLFGQYAHGFRAPPYDNANFGFTNRAFGYQILPNGDLKSETSDGIEAGLRGRFGRASFQVNAFYNKYNDFIDTQVVGNAGGLTQFQYQNISNVSIWGAEAKGDWRILPQWTLRSAVAWARGENDRTGAPVDSVDPVKAVAGVAWASGTGLGAEAVVTRGWRHDRVSDRTFFRAPAYTVLDLLVRYEVNTFAALNAGLFNVTNEKYFVSQDVTGLAASSPIRDLYAQPGRYAAVNATLRW